MKAVILDGYFAGLVVHHDGNPTLRLRRPHTITWCDCDPSHDDYLNEVPNSILEYKLAARGFDDSAIYTLSGDLFEPLIKGRDWVVDKRKHPLHPAQPIYLHCRDDNAWEPAARGSGKEKGE